MRPVYEMRVEMADLIFDIRDAYAATRGGPSARPLPLESLKLRFVARIVAGARVEMAEPLELITTRSTSGFYLYFGKVRLPSGEVRQRMLQDGNYWVRIESLLYQEIEVQVRLPDPRNPILVNLAPGPAYPFAVTAPLRLALLGAGGCTDAALHGRAGTTLLRGSLRDHNGGPVVGATVSASRADRREQPAYVTGKTGDWLVVFPPDNRGADWPTGPVTVHFVYPAPAGGAAAPVFDVADVCVVRGYDTGLLQTAVRGRVTEADGRPARGVQVTLTGLDAGGAPVLPITDLLKTDADGYWAYYFDPGGPPANVVNLVVSAPDADWHPQTQTVPVTPRATVVVPAISR